MCRRRWWNDNDNDDDDNDDNLVYGICIWYLDISKRGGAIAASSNIVDVIQPTASMFIYVSNDLNNNNWTQIWNSGI